MNRARNFSHNIKSRLWGKFFSTEHKLMSSLLSMQRNDHTCEILQEIRWKNKEKASKYVPGTISLQVLGSGAWGAPQSVYLFTDQTRYLFNVGEGCQRLAHEHKMKLSKLEHIFITQPVWENFGGLPGVALTIQDVGVPEITLHGPPGTSDLFPATQRFVVLNGLRVKMADCCEGDVFDDNVMSVKYVPIKGSLSNDLDHLKGIELLKDDDIHYYSRSKQQLRNQLPPVVKERVSPIVMCYVCELKSKPGVLDFEKCVDCGVTPGPLLGKLKNGEDVVLPDGKIVLASDVTSPEQPGPLFLVIDCPSEEYIDGLINARAFNDLNPHAVIQFTPSRVQNNPVYKKWFERFSTATNISINTENQCIGSVAVHRVQNMLHLIHPQIFPLLECTVGNGIGTMSTLHLRPMQSFDAAQNLSLNPEEYVNEVLNNTEFNQLLPEFRKSAGEIDGDDYPRIVFLGTGSCIPNKTRNTSGILIQMTENDSVLLDCGEATFSQIIRLFGVNRATEILKTLRMVYVSHLHADHHIGLIGLLKGRARLIGPTEPIYLLAPQQIMNWLQFYHIRFESILSYFQLIPNGDFRAGNARKLSKIAENMIERLNCKDVGTVAVRHCPNAFGVAITHKTGWKITYSGDTMPCEDLVVLGQNSDVLIHEATMEDELKDQAVLKFHSTTSQAIDVGRKMNAKFTILTHFSQRYAKIPRLNNVDDNVGIAFDNMIVTPSQLPLLSKMLPLLKHMFAEHCEEMDAKALKRLVRDKMKRSAPVMLKNIKKKC